MKNKVLIKLIVPEIDESFDVFIPVKELIWKVKKLLVKSVYDMTGGTIDMNREYMLINKNTSETYKNNVTVLSSDIRNATELILLSIKDAHHNAKFGTPDGAKEVPM